MAIKNTPWRVTAARLESQATRAENSAIQKQSNNYLQYKLFGREGVGVNFVWLVNCQHPIPIDQ